MGVQVSVPTLKSFGTLHIFASFYIFNLDISDASGQMVIYLSVILTVNQNLQILAGARRDGISGGLSRRGLGRHHWALLWLPWTMARVPMTKA